MPKIGPVPVSDNSRSKWVGLSQETVRWIQECLHSVQKRIPLACLQFNGLGKCVQYTSNICLYAQLHGICIKTYLRMYWSASVSRMHVVYTHPVCKLLSACGVTFRHVQRRACIYSIYGMALSFFLLSSFLPFFLYSFLLSFYSSLCHVSFLSYHCIYLSVWLSLSIYRSISWWDINGFHHFCKNCENIYISRTILDATAATLLESFCSEERLAFLWPGATSNHNQSRWLAKVHRVPYIPDMFGLFLCHTHHVKDPITIYQTMIGSLYKHMICANWCSIEELQQQLLQQLLLLVHGLVGNGFASIGK